MTGMKPSVAKMKPLSESEFADLAERVSIEEQLDLGTTVALRVLQEGNEFFLLSTASGQFAQLMA